MKRKLGIDGLAVICVLLVAGCGTSPADSEQQSQEDSTILGVWERVEDQDRWEFTEDDSLFLMHATSRSYCVWDWGTYEVRADSISLEIHDGSCAGTWVLSEESDTLVFRFAAPCDSVTILVRVSGPSHTDVPHCD